MAPVLAAAATLVAYGRLAAGRLPAAYDVLTYALPNRVQATAAMRRLHLPQWDPYRLAGTPFLANPQTAVLYPPHWLLLPLPPATAMAVSFAAHLAVLAAGVALFARRALRCSNLAAAMAGVAAGLSGFAHGQLEHYEQVTSIAWVPWALVAADAALVAPGWRAAAGPVAGVAAGLALVALAGHTQYLLVAVVLLGVYAVVVQPAPARLARVAAGAALGGGIAAAQLVPALLLAGESVRRGGLSLAEADQLAVPPGALAGALVPDYTGRHAGSFEWWAWTAWAVLGLVVLALATRAGGRRGAGLAAVAVTGAVLAVGSSTPVFRLVHAAVPGAASFRVPARWLLLPSLALPLLAAAGLDALRAGVPVRRAGAAAAAVALVGAAVALGVGDVRPGAGSLAAGAAIVVATAAAGVSVRHRPRRGRAVAGAVAVVAVAELVVAGAHTLVHDPALEPQPHRTLDVTGRVLSVGREPAGDRRAQRLALVPNTNVYEQAPSIDGYDGGLIVSRRWARSMAALTGRGSGFDPIATLRSNVNSTGGAALDPVRLAELDVATVVAHDPPFDVARLLPTGFGPRARRGDVTVWTTDRRMPVFPATGDVPPGLRLRRHAAEPERIDVDVPAGLAGRVVVVSEAWAPGWTVADVDPGPAGGVRLRRHRDLLLAFDAPPTGGRVVLRYRTPGLVAGAAVSAGSIGAALALVAVSRRRPPSTR